MKNKRKLIFVIVTIAIAVLIATYLFVKADRRYKQNLAIIVNVCNTVSAKWRETDHRLIFVEGCQAAIDVNTPWAIVEPRLKRTASPEDYVALSDTMIALRRAGTTWATEDDNHMRETMERVIASFARYSHTNQTSSSEGQTPQIQPNGELTRDLAAKLINAYPASVERFAFREDGVKAALRNGVIIEKGGFGSYPTFFFSPGALTSIGAYIQENYIAPRSEKEKTPGVRLKTPVTVKVREVTGIALGSDPNVRIAEYTASYLWPEPMTVMVMYGYGSENAKATFRRYDDGWRVVSLDHP